MSIAIERSAGTNCCAVGVATGGHSMRELTDSGADVVFEDLADTARFLELLDKGTLKTGSEARVRFAAASSTRTGVRSPSR